MSPLFGHKREEGKTVLLLDVENGSVGTALVRLSQTDAPRLFGEMRVHTPILKTHNAALIAKEIGAAAHTVLQHIAEVAARIRIHFAEPLGTIAHTAVFMSPPWGSLNVGTPQVPHPITQALYNALGTTLGHPLSTSFHPFATATAHMVPALFPHEEQYLLCIITGEVAELIALTREAEESTIVGHATLPLGRNSIVRTLMSHGGLTEAEVLSLLKLQTRGLHHPQSEPLNSFAAHMAEEFKSVMQEFAAVGPLRSVFIIAHEPIGEWFARSLTEHPSMEELFPEGGTVRALRGSHISPYLAIHAHKPDLVLLLEALFVDARHGAGRLAVIR